MAKERKAAPGPEDGGPEGGAQLVWEDEGQVAEAPAEDWRAEAERLRAEVEALRAERGAAVAAARREGAVRAALAPLVHDPEDVLPRLALDEVELDGCGVAGGSLAALLAPLRREKPYLFKAPEILGVRPAAGAGRGDDGGGGGAGAFGGGPALL